MTEFKEKLEIDLLKAMTYTEINNLLNKLNRQISDLQKRVNQGQELPIHSVVQQSEQLHVCDFDKKGNEYRCLICNKKSEPKF